MLNKVLAALLVLIPTIVSAQGTDARMYGAFFPGDPSHYPKADAIAIWDNLDPGWSGDLISGLGDMEAPFVADACGFCPAGCTCVCAGTSRVDPEASKIYKSSQALKYTVDAGNSNIQVFFPLSANGYLDPGQYQITFKARGDVGGEDIIARIEGQQAPYGATPLTYYQCSNDTWGGAVDCSFSNITTSWAQFTIYVNQYTGSTMRVAKISIRRNGASQVFYIDDVQVIKLRNTSQASSPGSYTFTPAVTSDPAYAGARSIQVIAGQRTKRGLFGNGSTDYMVMAADDDKFDASQTGNLSVCGEFMEDSAVANASILNKSGATTSWQFYYSGSALNWLVSKDGTTGAGSYTAVGKAFSAGSLSAGCGTYARVGDGSSTLQSCVNHEATCSISAVGVSPMFNSATKVSLMDRETGTGVNWNGSISRIGIYNMPLSAANISRWVSPYFAKSIETTGMYVTTCTQAASHAICDPSKCVDGTANRCVPDSQWQPIFGQYTEACSYNSVETVVGGDDAPTFTGYSSYIDPAATLTAYRADTMHGNISMRVKAPSLTYNEIYGPCETAGVGNVIQGWVAMKKLVDLPAELYVQLWSYTDAACTTGTSYASLWGGDATSVWDWYGGSVSTAGKSSYRVVVSVIQDNDTPTDLLIDTWSAVASPVRTPWVHAAGAADVVVNSRDYRVHNPLADVRPNGRYAYQDGFCAGMWVWTDWAGNDGVNHYLYYTPGTAGFANAIAINKLNTNILYFGVFDSAATEKYKYLVADSTNWQSGTAKYVEVCSSNTGTFVGRHYETGNNTWYSWTTAGGLGTAIQAGQSANTQIGLYGAANANNGFIGPLVIGPYSATWPLYGFDKRPRQSPY